MSERNFESKMDAAPQPSMSAEGGIQGAVNDCYSPSQAKSFDANASKTGQSNEQSGHLDIPDIFKSIGQIQDSSGEKQGHHGDHHRHHMNAGSGSGNSDSAGSNSTIGSSDNSSTSSPIDATSSSSPVTTDASLSGTTAARDLTPATASDATPVTTTSDAPTNTSDAPSNTSGAATSDAPTSTPIATDTTPVTTDATTATATTSDATGTVPGAYKMPEGVLSQTLSVLDDNPTNMTVDSLLALKAQGITGVRDKYQLPNDRPLTQSELDFIDKDFAAARAAGMPMIPIFSYTQDAGGADAPASLIETQLAQLAPVLTKNEDTIGAVELGFVGAWGEWNRSTNGNDNNTALAKTIYDDFTKALPDTPVAFRYVDLVRSIFGDNPPANVIMQNDSIGQSSGDTYAQKDAGSYLQPGDYEYIENHHLITIGENQEQGTPAEILSRIQQTNITAIDFWGSVGDSVKSSGMYDQIMAAMKTNAIADGIPVS